MDNPYAGQGDYAELAAWQDALDEAIDTMRDERRAAEDAEAEYRRARALLTLALRDDGVPVTVIPDIVRGDPEVAELKRRWGHAQALYDATYSQTFAIQNRIKNLERLIDREWSRPSNG